MKRQKRNRALSLAVLALGFFGAAPGLAAVTPGGDATVAATAAGSSYVGDSSNGTLDIDGGSVLTNAFGHIGRNVSSIGRAKVAGTGSSWVNTSALYIGNKGSGTLAIEDGGLVRADGSAFSYLAYESGSTGTATVTGPESRWTNNSYLLVGYQGSGSLAITAGGQVSSTYGYIGSFPSATGTATVSGVGSAWTTSNPLYVGDKGKGTLTIEAGGQVITSSS